MESQLTSLQDQHLVLTVRLVQHSFFIAHTDCFSPPPQVYTRTPVSYLHFDFEPNARLQQPIPAGWTSFAYVLNGSGTFGNPSNKTTKSDAHHTVVFSTGESENGVEIVAGDK